MPERHQTLKDTAKLENTFGESEAVICLKYRDENTILAYIEIVGDALTTQIPTLINIAIERKFFNVIADLVVRGLVDISTSELLPLSITISTQTHLDDFYSNPDSILRKPDLFTITDIASTLSFDNKSYKQFNLPMHLFTTKQYIDMFINDVLQDKDRATILYPRPYSIAFIFEKPISELTNSEFACLTSYLMELRNFFLKEKIEVPKEHLENIHLLQEIISQHARQLLLSLINSHAEIIRNQKPQKGFFSHNSPAKNFIDTLSKMFDGTTRLEEELLIVLKEHKEAVFQPPTDWTLLGLYCQLSALMVHIGYPKHLFFPSNVLSNVLKQLDEIGVSKLSLEAQHPSNLFFVMGDDNQLLIWPIDEIIQRLGEREKFEYSGPDRYIDIKPEHIDYLLYYPEIVQALQHLHEKILESILGDKATTLGPLLWQTPNLIGSVEFIGSIGDMIDKASTHNPANEGIFQEQDADAAIAKLKEHMEQLDEKTQELLLAERVFVPVRNKQTSFKELFSEMQHQGCAGMLGLSLRQWSDAVKQKAEEAKEIAATQKTCFSPYLEKAQNIKDHVPPALKSDGDAYAQNLIAAAARTLPDTYSLVAKTR